MSVRPFMFSLVVAAFAVMDESDEVGSADAIAKAEAVTGSYDEEAKTVDELNRALEAALDHTRKLEHRIRELALSSSTTKDEADTRDKLTRNITEEAGQQRAEGVGRDCTSISDDSAVHSIFTIVGGIHEAVVVHTGNSAVLIEFASPGSVMCKVMGAPSSVSLRNPTDAQASKFGNCLSAVGIQMGSSTTRGGEQTTTFAHDCVYRAYVEGDVEKGWYMLNSVGYNKRSIKQPYRTYKGIKKAVEDWYEDGHQKYGLLTNDCQDFGAFLFKEVTGAEASFATTCQTIPFSSTWDSCH